MSYDNILTLLGNPFFCSFYYVPLFYHQEFFAPLSWTFFGPIEVFMISLQVIYMERGVYLLSIK